MFPLTSTTKRILATGCLAAVGLQVQAQHYPAGIEGIKGASLPPSGLYFRDYNYFYTADTFKNGPPDFNVFAYVQAPRLIWMTDFKPFGLDYGMDIIVPFSYQRVTVNGVNMSKFGLSDIAVEPLLLSKHFGQFDISAGYAFWAPTGDFNPNNFASPGKGYWGHMLTLGGVWYPDQDKTISLSLLDRYEINQQQDQTGVTPGQHNTLEVGAGYALSKIIEVGLAGYYQQQTTDDSGPNTGTLRDYVVGAGPEIGLVIPSIGLVTSLRYAYEFKADNRAEGHTFCLTLTKRF